MKRIDPAETDKPWDVIIIGAGPAGTTAGALLAGTGRRVLILEKGKFPRYHIGESMIPFCWFTLQRLGVLDRMAKVGFQQKLSVQFVTSDGRGSRPFYFFQHYDHPSSRTWQVDRATFDKMLFDNAREKGAVILEETRVTDLIRRDGHGEVIGVRTAKSKNGQEDAATWFAPVVLDCSGRDALAISKNKWRTRDPRLNKVAVWTYYEGAMRDPGIDEGNTTVAYVPEKGWFWYIPLRDNRVSVGIVAERDYLFRDPDAREPGKIFEREIHENKWIEQHLAPGTPCGEFWVTGEYSYRSRFCADDGLLLAGDAFAFLDPVFSSGLFLALKSGELAADAIESALAAGDVSAERFSGYGETLCAAIERMRKTVYAFYDPGFSFGDVVKKHPELRPLLTDLLIGNFFDPKFDALFAAFEELCDLPAELDYGMRVAGEKSMAV